MKFIARTESRGIKSLSAAVALLGAALFAPNAALAQPLMNGDFENTSLVGNPAYYTLAAGSTAITGWTVGRQGIDYIKNYWQDASGNFSLDLSGTGSGSISQAFDTLAGHTYQVTFAMAGNPDDMTGPELVKQLRAVAANFNDVFQFHHDPSSNSKTDMGWIEQSFSFTALANQTTLSFASMENSAYGPAIDNVRVADITHLPEPGTFALIGLGLAGLGLKRRKKA